MKISSLVKRDNSIVFDGERMNIYIPKSYFQKKLATYNGKFVNTMGVFLFEITTEENFNKGKDGGFHTLKLPVKINFEYDSKYSCKRKIEKFDSDSYEVFILKKGNIFIDNIYREQSAQYCKDFVVSMLHNGNIPNYIPYNEIINLYLDNLKITNVNLNNPALIYEIIISECCRSKNNIKIPFRKIAGKSTETNLFNYKNINIKSIPSLNSTFTDMAFENMNQSIINSVGRSVKGEEEKETSPIEKTIKY
jgi:hypothetical protein